MIAFVLILLIGAAVANSREEPRVFCGQELVKAHALLCYGYETIPEEFEMATTKLPPTGMHSRFRSEIPDRFTHKLRRAVVTRSQSQTRQLIEECCMKPCNLADLLFYC